MSKEGNSIYYFPYLHDNEFMNTYSLVRSFSLVDVARLYGLWRFMEQAQKLDAGAYLEVGVWRGGSGCLMAHKLQLLNDPSRLYLCDTFSGVVKAGEMDAQYNGGEHSDTDIAIVEHLAQSMSLDNVRILEGIFPEETADRIEESTFRFCHIDVDVYQSGKDVLNWVWDRLVRGGIIVFDDYGFTTCPGITRLVEDVSNDKDKMFIWNASGQSFIIKI
jgi:O-methyltransferase